MLAPFSHKAKAFFKNPAAQDRFFTMLEGSIRSGKTWAMMVKILALNTYKVAGLKVLIGFSKTSIYNNVLRDIFTFVGTRNYRYNAQSGQLWLYGVEWRVIGVSNEGAEKAIRGLTAGVIVWDEVTQAPKNVFDMAMSRLSPEGARFYGTTNPDNPYHYLLTDYMEHEDFKHLVTRIKFNLDDNLSLSEDTRARYMSMYHGVFYRRFILAEWVAGDGIIFGDSWSDDRNLFDDGTRPIGLLGQGGYSERFYSIDYGTSNATCFLEWYDDGKTLWCTREWYWDSSKQARQLTDSQQADELLKFTGGTNWKIILDPSALSFKVELRSRGFVVKDANNEVLDGIRKMSTALANGIMRFHKQNCPTAIAQIQSYAWDGKALKSTGKEQPIKANDHAVDPARYAVATNLPQWRLAA